MPEVFQELDTVLASRKRMLFLVDGHVRYRRAAEYIGQRLPGNSMLVISASEDLDQISLSKLGNEIGGNAREIDLNQLDHEELVQWNRLLERWGYWETKKLKTAKPNVCNI